MIQYVAGYIGIAFIFGTIVTRYSVKTFPKRDAMESASGGLIMGMLWPITMPLCLMFLYAKDLKK